MRGSAGLIAAGVLLWLSTQSASAGPVWLVNSEADNGTGGCDAIECTL
ncbi:MAG: hypothetical protein ABI559_01815 [Chloroflexota bacterium]